MLDEVDGGWFSYVEKDLASLFDKPVEVGNKTKSEKKNNPTN